MAVAADHNDDLSMLGMVPFSCSVVFEDDRAVIAANGELDLATVPVLLRELRAALTLPIAAVAVDLGGTTFLDSSGIGALLEACRVAEELHTRFELVSVTDQCLLTLRVAGLTELFGLPDA